MPDIFARVRVAGGVVALLLVLRAPPVECQDSAAVRITPVRVTVTRDAARSTFDLPFALTRLTIDSSRAGTRRASLTDMLAFVPGVSVANRFNPTQDPRLAIRGFGARSAFGIRGVRILRDGIPLTQADGQTAVDYLDLETVAAVEVIRGSAGALYGNSSGGVVDFRTEAPPDSGAEARVRAFYADGVKRASAYVGGRARKVGMQATSSWNQGQGPRKYSRFRNTSANADARWAAGGTRYLAQVSWFDSPLAQNPGSLTAAEMASDRTAADPTNVRKKASKTVTQSILALQASHDGDRGSLNVNLHGGLRSLDNPQSFAIVSFDRMTLGGSARGQYNLTAAGRPVRLAAGIDLLSQDDDRQNFANCAGLTGTRPATCPGTSDQGSITVDQRERVLGLGAYARAEVDPTERLSLAATVRGDRTRFGVLDHRPTGVPGEQSRTLSDVTPMAGINWRVAALASLYANVSSSFETPTTTELANQPDGSGGLNRALKPQHGRTIEAGAKGIWHGQLSYDLALYRVTTTDELIPFEVPDGSGRRYYRNAGHTERRGAEIGLSAARGIFSLGASGGWLRYTYQDFVVSGTSYRDNHVPGVAPATLSAYATARPAWALVAVELQHAARQPADDANANYANAYTVVNARLALELTRLGAQPVIGIDNIFDRTYAANVVSNASNGRFFEPGPGRTVWVGLRVYSSTR